MGDKVKEIRAALVTLDQVTSGVRKGMVLVPASELAKLIDYAGEKLAVEQDWDRTQMALPDYVEKWGQS